MTREFLTYSQAETLIGSFFPEATIAAPYSVSCHSTIYQVRVYLPLGPLLGNSDSESPCLSFTVVIGNGQLENYLQSLKESLRNYFTPTSRQSPMEKTEGIVTDSSSASTRKEDINTEYKDSGWEKTAGLSAHELASVSPLQLRTYLEDCSALLKIFKGRHEVLMALQETLRKIAFKSK